jgi:hypothetical protein
MIQSDIDRTGAYPKELTDGLEEIQRTKLVKSIPDQCAEDANVHPKAFNVLTSLLNLIGEQIRYVATFRQIPIVADAGAIFPLD